MSLTKIITVYLIVNMISWLIRHRFLSLSVRKLKYLSSKTDIPPDFEFPRVSVIVSARNEERNIRRCIESLLKQDYPNLEIIAVNDRSTDRTGEILKEFAKNSGGKLKVIEIDDLPSGWFGKHHAMHQASMVANGEYLLFTDADCIFICPSTITAAVLYSVQNGIDLLSVFPRLDLDTFWEKLIQPMCSIILMIWFRPERANSKRRKTAYANGAFMLFSRKAYDKVGGHQAVRDKICEDMALAKRVKEGGFRLYVIHNRDLYRTKMYETLKDTIVGWSRIFFGSFDSLVKVILAILLLTVMSLLPYVILLIVFIKGCVSGWILPHSVSTIGVWSILVIVAQISVVIRFCPLFGVSWYYGFLYPLAAFFAFLVLGNTILRFLVGKVEWKGKVQVPSYRNK